MIHLTLASVRDAVRAEIDKAGEDFYYEPPGPQGCVYTWEGKPSCLIGRALHRLGVPLHEMGRPGTANWLMSSLGKKDVIAWDREEVPIYLRHLQSAQDYGDVWSEVWKVGEAWLISKGVHPNAATEAHD